MTSAQQRQRQRQRSQIHPSIVATVSLIHNTTQHNTTQLNTTQHNRDILSSPSLPPPILLIRSQLASLHLEDLNSSNTSSSTLGSISSPELFALLSSSQSNLILFLSPPSSLLFSTLHYTHSSRILPHPVPPLHKMECSPARRHLSARTVPWEGFFSISIMAQRTVSARMASLYLRHK